MFFENTELESDNEMGPGTDLVLSLLSVIITILAVVGMSQPQLETQVPEEPITVICDLPDCQPEPSPMEIQQELNAAKDTIVELQYELENLHNAQAETQESGIVYGNIVELHEGEFAAFERNAAQLQEQDLPLLKRQLRLLYDNILENNANVIRIHGYASPEPRHKGRDKMLDSNMDLSVQRSLAIMHALHRLGVEYNCMVVEGYGRSRSRFLMTFLNQRNMTVQEWDEMYQEGFDQDIAPSEAERLRAELEQMYSQDRRVDLIAAIDQKSPCKPPDLAKMLEKAIL